MLSNTTIDKLLDMRFRAMADAFRIQQDDPSMKELDFEERFGLLVDAEYSRRKSNRLKQLIHDAEFEEKDASYRFINRTEPTTRATPKSSEPESV